MPPRNEASVGGFWCWPRTESIHRRSAARSRLSRLAGELAIVAIVIVALAALISTVAMKRSDEASGGTSLKDTGPVGEAVALSPDGKTLASCGGTNALRLWRLNGSDEERELDPLVLPPNSVPVAVAFSPDGTLLVAAGHECLAVWRREQGRYVPLVQKGGQTIPLPRDLAERPRVGAGKRCWNRQHLRAAGRSRDNWSCALTIARSGASRSHPTSAAL